MNPVFPFDAGAAVLLALIPTAFLITRLAHRRLHAQIARRRGVVIAMALSTTMIVAGGMMQLL